MYVSWLSKKVWGEEEGGMERQVVSVAMVLWLFLLESDML